MRDFIKILKRYVRPYRKFFGLNLLFTLLGSVAGVFSFAMISPILDILFGTQDLVTDFWAWDSDESFTDILKHNFEYLISNYIQDNGATYALGMVGIYLIVLSFFRVSLTYLASFFIIPLRSGIVRDIRKQLYNKIISLPIGFFSDERKGDVMSRMTGDVQEIENSVISSIDVMFKNPIIIAVYLGAMIVLSWKLTLFVLVILPISGSIIGKIGKSLKRTSQKGQTQLGVILIQIEETLSGLRIIKAFNAEGKVNARFGKEAEKYMKISNRMFRKRQLAHPVSEFLGTVIIAIVLWFGGYLILSNESSIDADEFIMYLVFFYSIINPAKAFSTGLYNIQKGMASMERVDRILMAENHIVSPDKPVECTEFKSEIIYNNVSFKYDKEYVLKNIDLKIEKGKTIALVGQSGSGKSTMVDLLPRFYDVTEGEITIDGIDVRHLGLTNLRRFMGNVNQDPILFNDTFFNNIAFGVPDATLEDVISAAKVANAHDFIIASEEGYDSNIGDRGGKLSGGQRQRISIARAILANPPVLILDEATSALDTESERLVQDALENLMRNRTTIVIAHRLSTVVSADEICVLREGKIVERGKHDELIASDGVYKKLHDMQKLSTI